MLSYLFCCWKAWQKGCIITRLENKKLDKKFIVDNTKPEDTSMNVLTTVEQKDDDVGPNVNLNAGPSV